MLRRSALRRRTARVQEDARISAARCATTREKRRPSFVLAGGVHALLARLSQVRPASLARLRPLDGGWVRMLEEVDGMEVVAESHEDAAVVRVLLADAEAEDIAVKRFRALCIGNAQRDVPDLLHLHHRTLLLASAG